MQGERIRCGSLALAVLVILGGSARAQDATTSPPLPPPGRLVDVGGWRLHLNCAGEARTAQPTVILEAGAGDFSVDWSLVQPGVARFARVCSYDRAGSGWSELGPRPRTMNQIVYELHTLLDKAGERPPYVLVGHSFGGGLVRLYQSNYPADVVSVVLVDAAADNPWRQTPDRGLVRSSDLATGKPVPEVKTSDPLRYSEIPERLVTMIKEQVPQLSAHANDPPRDKLPADAQRMRTWSYAQVKMHLSNDNPFEAEELGTLRARRTGTAHALGDLPLIVLSRGRPEDSSAADQKAEEEHTRDQSALVAMSRIGKQVVATRSGHHIPLEEPELVVAAIRDVVAAAVQPPEPLAKVVPARDRQARREPWRIGRLRRRMGAYDRGR
jgi:pimeloyl-ACP methyl ester carboxylesterase